MAAQLLYIVEQEKDKMIPIGILTIFAIALLWVFYGISKESSRKKAELKKRPTRIDHPHYFEEDDHECFVCGTRFWGKGMTCPKCGAKFTGTREDDGEFIEEMELWDDEDDE